VGMADLRMADGEFFYSEIPLNLVNSSNLKERHTKAFAIRHSSIRH